MKKNIYINKQVNRVNHQDSETFFTREYITELKKTLGSAQQFREKTAYERLLLQEQLDYMSHDDYNIKTYLHKSINEGNSLYKLFPVCFNKFKETIKDELLYDTKKSQRSTKKSFNYKFIQFYNHIMKMLLAEGFDLDFISKIDDDEIQEVLEKYLTPEIMFDMFCVILLKSARDSMFINEKNLFNTKTMSVLHSSVIYDVYNKFVLNSLTHSIVFKVTNKRKVVPLDSLLRSIRTFLIYNHPTIAITAEYKLFIDVIDSLFKVFAYSGIFEDVTTEYMDNRKQKRYYFPVLLTNELGKFTRLPRIARPPKIDQNNLEDFIIKSSFNQMKITSSTSMIDALNISNLKRFSINEMFLKILDLLEHNNNILANRPIPSSFEISQLDVKITNLDVNINNFTRFFVDRLQLELSKKNQELVTPFQFRHVSNVSVTETKVISERTIIEQKKQDMSIRRKGGITRLTLSKILQDFPLYYTNTICNTTRVFAREYLLSRHIGCLKLLRGEYTPIYTKIDGLIHMVRAYYLRDDEIYNKFQEFIKEKQNKTRFKIEEFISDNTNLYIKEESVAHYMLLEQEIKQVISKQKTKYMIQIDQVASGLVFMSILFKNKELAIHSNVHSENGTQDPYSYAMSNIQEYYDQNIDNKNGKVLELCLKSRKLHKYALMCYSYKQSAYGRTQDFTDLWVRYYNKNLNTEEWKSLNEVSSKYADFINTLYPGLNTQIEILDRIIELVVRDCGKLSIRTLEGAIIEWYFNKTKREIRKSFNPHTLSPESYALYTPISKDNKLVPDIQQFKTKFLSYLVHSLDAGVMRSIIRNMYRDHGYRIDHLHDCIMLHPTKVDAFYEVLNKVYSKPTIHDYMNTNVFDIFRSSISSEMHKEFDHMVAEFNSISNKTDFGSFKGDVYKMYTYEV